MPAMHAATHALAGQEQHKSIPNAPHGCIGCIVAPALPSVSAVIAMPPVAAPVSQLKRLHGTTPSPDLPPPRT